MSGQIVSIAGRGKASTCPEYRWPGDDWAERPGARVQGRRLCWPWPLPALRSPLSALGRALQRLFAPKAHKTAKINRLIVLCPYWNPCGYESRRRNYRRFAEGMQRVGAELWTAEIAFDGDGFDVPGARLTLRGSRERNLLWQKERLINLLVDRLPRDCDAVAWVDADVLFLNPGWLDEAKAVLETYPAAQLWESCYTLYPAGSLEFRKRSLIANMLAGVDGWQSGKVSAPGGAWAARADWLRRHKLFDRYIVGGGDSAAAMAMTGRELRHARRRMNRAWLAAMDRWAKPIKRSLAGRVGCVRGDICCLAHGAKQDRRYSDRYDWLAAGGYDPDRDVTVDDQGLLAWTDSALRDKPQMVRAVGQYFDLRREDG